MIVQQILILSLVLLFLPGSLNQRGPYRKLGFPKPFEVNVHDHEAGWIDPVNIMVANRDTTVYFVRDGQIFIDPNVFNRILEEARGDLKKGAMHYHHHKLHTHSQAKGSQEIPLGNAIIPTTIYPEILVVVTYELYEKFNFELKGLVEYIFVLFNGVNLNFRGIQNPQISLTLAGLVVAEDPESFDFIRSNVGTVANVPDVTFLFSNEALQDGSRWLFDNSDTIPLKSYDLAIILSPLRFCPSPNDECVHKSYFGSSFNKGACATAVPEINPEKFFQAGIVSHLGVFDSINTISHEIGHLLGAGHDGEHEDCTDFSGHMMTGVNRFRNSTLWSKCTLREFGEFLEAKGWCLFNKPHLGPILPAYLPGKLWSADKQCEKLHWTKSCEVGDALCAELQCQHLDRIVEGSQRCKRMGYSTPPGTECGPGKICINLQCLDENSFA